MWNVAAVLPNAALGALIAFAIFASGPARSQASIPQAVQAFIESAKKEGSLVVFGQTVNPDQEREYNRAFNEYYGFDLQLRMVSGLHPAKVAELVQSVPKGVPSGIDVFWTATEQAANLERGGVLEPVNWPAELGVEAALRWGKMGLRAHDGTLTVVSYNTKMVPPEKAPKSYFDLLDPMYKGRIATPRTASPFVYISYHLGEEETAELLQSLFREQGVRVMQSFPDVTNRVLSGEFAIGIGPDIFQQRRQGAPVEFAPVDPLIVTPWASHIMKDARSPNAGRLWAYFLTTPEGQKAMNRIRGISRVDAEGTDLWQLAQGKKVVVVDDDYIRENGARLTQEFGRIMGIVRGRASEGVAR